MSPLSWGLMDAAYLHKPHLCPSWVQLPSYPLWVKDKDFLVTLLLYDNPINASQWWSFIHPKADQYMGGGPYLSLGNWIHILWQEMKCILILGHKWIHMDSDQINIFTACHNLKNLYSSFFNVFVFRGPKMKSIGIRRDIDISQNFWPKRLIRSHTLR